MSNLTLVNVKYFYLGTQKQSLKLSIRTGQVRSFHSLNFSILMDIDKSHIAWPYSISTF